MKAAVIAAKASGDDASKTACSDFGNSGYLGIACFFPGDIDISTEQKGLGSELREGTIISLGGGDDAIGFAGEILSNALRCFGCSLILTFIVSFGPIMGIR